MRDLHSFQIRGLLPPSVLRRVLPILALAVLMYGCTNTNTAPDCTCGDPDGDREAGDGDPEETTPDGDQEITDGDGTDGDAETDGDDEQADGDDPDGDQEITDGDRDDEIEDDPLPRCFPSDSTLASSIVIDSKGRWVVAGSHTPDRQASDGMLARFLPDGTLDTDFPGNGCISLSLSLEHDRAGALALQPDDNLLVAPALTGGAPRGILLLRLHDDGSLDTEFAERGLFSYTTESGAVGGISSIFPLQDGKILLVGGIDDSTGNATLFLRLNDDGSLDTSFGVGGVVRTANPAAGRAILQEDGKIVQVGRFKEPGAYGNYALFRYHSDGSPDDSFGENGMAVTTGGATGGESLSDVLHLPDGSYFAVGQSYPDDWTDVINSAAIHFTADGTPDETFGPGGVFVIEVGPIDTTRRVVRDAQGRIWVLGNQSSFDTASPSLNTGYLARFSEDGLLDTSFADQGIYLIDLDPNGTSLSDFVLQPNGRVLVVGSTGDLRSGRKMLVRSIVLR